MARVAAEGDARLRAAEQRTDASAQADALSPADRQQPQQLSPGRGDGAE